MKALVDAGADPNALDADRYDMVTIAAVAGATVVMSNHTEFDGSKTKLPAMADNTGRAGDLETVALQRRLARAALAESLPLFLVGFVLLFVFAGKAHPAAQLRAMTVHDPKTVPEWEELYGRPPTPAELEDMSQPELARLAADPMQLAGELDWVAKLGANRSKLASFSIAKYGAQQGNDWQWFPDAGNGIRTSGADVTGNDPHDTSDPITPSADEITNGSSVVSPVRAAARARSTSAALGW